MIKNKIYNENNLKTMNRLDDNSIDGIITSPPYNLGKNPNHRKLSEDDYNLYIDNIDNLSEEEYLEIRINEFKEFQRIMKNDGVILYNMSYSKENPMLPLILLILGLLFMALFFKIGRRYLAIGILSSAILPLLVYGACWVVIIGAGGFY